jgi:hypothetical protein
LLPGGEDYSAYENREASEERWEDTTAVQMSEQVDNLGGVHDQESGSLHPEARSSVKHAGKVKHQHDSDQKPGAHEDAFAQRHDCVLPYCRFTAGLALLG